MVLHVIPTVTFGAGQNGAHTIEEWSTCCVHSACRLAIRLATEA